MHLVDAPASREGTVDNLLSEQSDELIADVATDKGRRLGLDHWVNRVNILHTVYSISQSRQILVWNTTNYEKIIAFEHPIYHRPLLGFRHRELQPERRPICRRPRLGN